MNVPHVQAAQKVFFAALLALPKEERGPAQAAAPWIKDHVLISALDLFLTEQPDHVPEAYWIAARHSAGGAGEAWADAPEPTRFAWALALETMRLFRPEPVVEPVEAPPPIAAKRIDRKRNGRIGRRVEGLEPPAEQAPAE